MDGTGGYYAKQNKSIRERQLSYDLIYMCDLKNKTEDHRGKRENKMKSERETNHKRLLNHRKQTEGCWKGVGWGNGLTG